MVTKEGYVKLADVAPETRERVRIFVSMLKINKCTLDGKNIKTLEDGILYAIKQAERVPELEEKIKELEKRLN